MPVADWLLKGEPRDVQIEALHRSYDGYRVKRSQDDPNIVPQRLVDSEGYSRTGPAKRWGHFLEQRLGKTPICLNEIELFRRDYDFRWAVGLAPNSFKDEWVAESERFGLSMPAHAFRSEDRGAAQRFVDRNRRTGGLLVLNYEALISPDTVRFLDNLIDDKTYLFGDETVKIKNHNATTTKNAIALAKNAGARRSMTGKPVVQGPHDMWSQGRFAGEFDGWNFFAFRNTFCKMGGFQGRSITGSKDEERFQSILSTWAFPARRVDWMKTPGSDYAIRPLQMLPEQKVHYKRMEKDLITFIEGLTPDEDIAIPADQIVTKLLKLAQIDSGFIIDEQGVAHDIMPPKSNPKVIELKAMLSDEIVGKTIIFCHFTHTIDILMEALKEFNPALIAGERQMRRLGLDVQTEKARFNSEGACRVVIGQSQAIKYGHTLQGTPDDPCLTEIFAENSYSLDDRAQGEERPQGVGQQGAIAIWDIVASPIARAALVALQRKEDVASAVMGYARASGLLPHAL